MDITAAQTIGAIAILIAVLAAIVVLAIHGTINGTQAMTGIMAVITLGGGALAVHAGVSVGAKAGAAAALAKKDAEGKT